MSGSQQHHISRRNFIRNSAAAAAVVSINAPLDELSSVPKHSNNQTLPWYRRITRWGQVNITEKDPEQYDVDWWRSYWKKTNTQGVIINAGGIVAYYPSDVPLHKQAFYLKGKDLFGNLCKAAHDDGLAVFARMDSNRAHEAFYNAHPDWFAVDSAGKPYKAADLYLSCIFSPYYTSHIPSILAEIATRYQPEGFTDNSWSGITRDMICYCDYCKASFKEKTGQAIPAEKNWNDKTYREWINWNYDRRIEIWELNNKITKQHGGADCVWAGMNSGSISGQARAFRNYREICKRADIIMLDHQARGNDEMLQHNTELGLMVHGMLGWDKLMPESMAMYQAGSPTFRLSSKPVEEARMWMINGIAGGIQPWWHHIAAYHEDRRMYDTAAPVMQWHKTNEQFLVNRTPVANVGVVWSQQNTDFFGRDDVHEKVEMPWKGITRALIKARIPYLPVHADDIEKETSGLSLLILPNIGVLTDKQLAAIKEFVSKGGNVLATGETSLYNEWGERKKDYGLSDIFGVHRIPGIESIDEDSMPKLAWNAGFHTYLRLHPELRKEVDGPKNGSEPLITTKRHAVLDGFERTDIFPFGGFVEKLKADPEVIMPMSFIPQFPVYPPETAWMRETHTDIGGLYLNTLKKGSRIVYMPASIDKLYGENALPDHGKLLGNLIKWALNDALILQIDGPGLLNVVLYQQKGKMILHLVNQTSEAAWNPPLDELISVGPIRIKLKLIPGVDGRDVQFRVGNQRAESRVDNGWASFTLKQLKDHELIVIR